MVERAVWVVILVVPHGACRSADGSLLQRHAVERGCEAAEIIKRGVVRPINRKGSFQQVYLMRISGNSALVIQGWELQR